MNSSPLAPDVVGAVDQVRATSTDLCESAAGLRGIERGSSGKPSGRDQLASVLAHIAPVRLGLDRLERHAIEAARQAGLSWKEIADTLRLESRQAAQQRLRRRRDRAHSNRRGD